MKKILWWNQIYEGKRSTFTGAEVCLSGPTMVSLEQAGWIERAEAPKSDAPFKVTTQGHYWKTTKDGRDAIKALPETEPKV
jgi:hypothetical protein